MFPITTPYTLRGEISSPPITERPPHPVIADMMMVVAAALAGTGGALLGVRGADAINRMLGRDAPPVNDEAV